MTSKWANNVGNQNWQTPQYFFDILKENFNIRLDAATDMNNPLHTKYFYTENDNGLLQPWMTWTYCNPPYAQCESWVRKAWQEMTENNIYSLLLLPANTDTIWFHKFIWSRYSDTPYAGITVKFLFKRMFFVNANDPAKFSNMLVIFGGNLYRNHYINMER